MKRFVLFFLVSSVVALSALRLTERHREEKADRSVALLADWQEIRDGAARMNLTDSQVLLELKNRHVTGIVMGGMTLGDLAARGRLTGLETSSLRMREASLGMTLLSDLVQRGFTDLALSVDKKTLSRRDGSFLAFKDVELGLDPVLLNEVKQSGLGIIYRLNRDPWMAPDNVLQWLNNSTQLRQRDGILFNSEDVPGGEEYLPYWERWVQKRSLMMPLFEFKPTKAALRLARLAPNATARAHTIPSAELRDLTEDQEKARWNRAVAERSCRFLLVHGTLNDSFMDHLNRFDRLGLSLTHDGWAMGWPSGHPGWRTPGRLSKIAGLIALLIAILAPISGLALAWPMAHHAGHSVAKRVGAFLLMSATTIAGGTVVAALAQSPLTQLQVVPFRGIKLAFILSWFGAIFILYSWKELRALLEGNVRRIDVAAGLLLIGLVGYAVIRSGNASSGWKHPAEQQLRNRLESSFTARPRFKEFALGHPLALLGFLLVGGGIKRRRAWVAKPLIAMGVVGQASMINSFCHLHSPIQLAYARSVTGLVLGLGIGLFLYLILQSLPPRKEL